VAVRRKVKGGKLPNPISPSIKRRREGRRRRREKPASEHEHEHAFFASPSHGRARARRAGESESDLGGGRGNPDPGAAPFRLPISLPTRIPGRGRLLNPAPESAITRPPGGS